MKVCSKCKLEKNIKEFHLSKAKKDGSQPYCKVCLNNVAKKDYKEKDRKSLFILRADERKKELKKILDQIRIYNGCAFCDEKEICCFDFHHLDPTLKDSSISKLWASKSKRKMFLELTKCVVVCSNCHRKIHSGILTPVINQLCKIPDNLKEM